MSDIDEIFGVEPPKTTEPAPEQPVGVNLEATVEKFKNHKKEYHTGSHSKYLIFLHMIFVCKYRKHLLQGSMDDDMKKLLQDAADEMGVGMEIAESDRNHIHMLLDVPPTMSPSSVAAKLKQLSTYRIWQSREADLKKHFWKERTFWSDGYFVCSTGDASVETIRKYIQEQG